MGDQKIVDAINFLGKEKRTNTLTTNNFDELIILFISEVNKKLPKNARTAKNYIQIYTPTIRLQNASYVI